MFRRLNRLQLQYRSGLTVWLLLVLVLFYGGCTFSFAPPPVSTPPPEPPPPAPEPENRLPVIGYLAAQQSTTPSGSAQIRCVATDIDGDTLFYTWSATDGAFKGEGDLITWIAPDKAGDYVITATVSDGRGGEAVDSITITVGRTVNRPPTVSRLVVTPKGMPPVTITATSEPLKISRWSMAEIECIASDPDGDELQFAWTVTGGRIKGKGSKIQYIVTDKGDNTVMVTVTDSVGRQTEGAVHFHVPCCSGG